MNSKSQFYIVAAIMIVLILSAMTEVSTYIIVKYAPLTIDDISNDLSRESYNIVEYGIYNEKDLNLLLDDFTGKYVGEYFLKKTKDANIIFVYGNKKNLRAVQYTEGKQGEIRLGSVSWVSLTPFAKVKELGNVEGKELIEVEFPDLNRKYNFELKDNEMFYFVIIKESGEEIFIKKSDKKSERQK